MKSASQMKSNPPPRLAAARSRSRSDNAQRCHSLRSRRFATREAGFHHEVISPTEGGFLPPEADLTEKALAFASAFSCGHSTEMQPPKL